MSSAARAAVTSALVALVLAAAWLFWPAQLGGSTTYVVTHGISMQPGFHTGDLAVLRPADSYEVGDVAAYYSPTLDTVVMHRIVAVDGDRFTFQGDNNDWLDQDHPTSDEVLGKLFRQVPQGGKALGVVTSPWALVLVFALALGVFGNSRRSRRGRHAPRRRTPAAAMNFSMPTRAQARQVATASGAVALLAAVAGGVLFSLPSTRSESRPVQVAQEGRYTYTGDARTGTTYPTGVVTTGDPIYTKLTDALTVSFEQTVTAPGLDSVTGRVRLELSVATGDGWTTTLGSSPAAPVQDGVATATIPIDPVLAAAYVGRHNAEIGGSAGTATISVTPVVEVTGVLEGQPFTAGEMAPLTFSMDATALRPPSASDLAPTQQVPVTVDDVVARSFTVLHVDVPIGAARLIALVVLAVAVVVAAGTGWIGRPRRGDAADEFAVRNASRILPVAGLSTGPNVVDVSDADALRRVAERFDGLVLHHAGPEGQTFAVQDAETTYRFVFADTAVRRTPPPPPPPAVGVPAPATIPLPRVA